LLASVLLTGTPLTGQEPSAEGPRLRVEVALVPVEVAVVDAAGRFVSDLKAENFRVSEDGATQPVRYFAPTRAPVRLALLVESSPAVFLLRHEHLTAARVLLRALRADDQVALYSYARTLRREVDFTTNKAYAEDRLDGMGRFGLGMADTNLRDAVASLLDEVNPPQRRTAVLVIGTGLDPSSAAEWEALRRRLGASQVTFFAVATGALLRAEPEKKKKRAETAASREVEAAFAEADARLRTLATASAGEAYFPRSAKELDKIYADIAERLRNLYTLAYSPANRARDGRFRSIRVELVDERRAPLVLRDPKGKPIAYRVFARPGYFAPRE
jgi:VWFA-related protein